MYSDISDGNNHPVAVYTLKKTLGHDERVLQYNTAIITVLLSMQILQNIIILMTLHDKNESEQFLLNTNYSLSCSNLDKEH